MWLTATAGFASPLNKKGLRETLSPRAFSFARFRMKHLSGAKSSYHIARPRSTTFCGRRGFVYRYPHFFDQDRHGIVYRFFREYRAKPRFRTVRINPLKRNRFQHHRPDCGLIEA